MATYLTAQIIAEASLPFLENESMLLKHVFRGYDKEYTKKVNGYSVGDTIQIEKPVRFNSVDGSGDLTSSFQEIDQGKVGLTLDTHRSVPIKITRTDLTLKMPDFARKVLKPAMSRLGQDIDSAIALLYRDVANFSGTPGTQPSTYDHLATPSGILDKLSVPMTERVAILDPLTNNSLASSLKGYFAEKLATDALKKNFVTNYANFDIFKSNSLKTHTSGVATGTPLVAGTITASTWLSVKDTNVSTVTTDGWTNSVTGILKRGDVINFAGVFAVNPATGESTGFLRDFVVTADVDSNGSGLASVIVSPAIITASPYATVTNVPADNAVITVRTKNVAATPYMQNLLFHPNAFTFASAPFVQLEGGIESYTATSESGLSITISKQGDINTFQQKWRADILYGTKAIMPELAHRLTA